MLLQRAVSDDPEYRKVLCAIVVVAANAGGAWTPIGDVTTTVRHGKEGSFQHAHGLSVGRKAAQNAVMLRLEPLHCCVCSTRLC